MPIIKMPVTKLGDPTVNYISLVNRGANRIPFRIVKQDKQESTMIDLASLNVSRLFKSEKEKVAKEQPQPTIVGFVTMKDEHFEMVKDGLKDAGFLVSKQYEESDGSVVFKQVDILPEEFTVLKMGEHLLALVDKLDADSLVEDTIYESLLKEESFIPSPEIATQGFSLAMGQISNSSDSMQDKVAKMELVTKDYNSYLTKLFSWVPARLSELAKELEANIAAHSVQETTDASLRGKIQDSPSKPDTSGANTGGADGVNAKGTPGPSAFDSELDDTSITHTPAKVAKCGRGFNPCAKKPDADGDIDDGDENPIERKEKGKACKEEEVASDLVSKMETMLAAMQSSMQDLVMKQVGEVSTQVLAVSTAVNMLKKSQDTLHDRVVEAEKVAKSAEAVVRGKVITSDIGNDALPGVQKAETFESQGFGGCIDTAFQTTVRKQAQSPLQRGHR